MEPQHLTYFKVENFKRFDSFEMSNLGQFNLIVGDNNVGKTSVLEALLFDDDLSNFINNFANTALFRNQIELSSIRDTGNKSISFWINIFKNKHGVLKFYDKDSEAALTVQLIKNSELSSGDRFNISRSFLRKKEPNFWLKLSDNKIEGINAIQIRDPLPDSMGSVYIKPPFVSANTGYDSDMTGIFFEYFNANKITRMEFIDSLKLIIEDIEDMKVHRFNNDEDMLGLSLLNHNDLIPLTRYGDGTIKLTRLLMKVWTSQNRRLMVDEIGSGIHFTRLKNYWITIVKLCSKYRVQLFATTHSLECQQAFADALLESDMEQYQKDARNITLLENKQGDVKAFTYTFEEFEFSLANGINTRGGGR